MESIDLYAASQIKSRHGCYTQNVWVQTKHVNVPQQVNLGMYSGEQDLLV